jgi:hypothetical protein
VSYESNGKVSEDVQEEMNRLYESCDESIKNMSDQEPRKEEFVPERERESVRTSSRGPVTESDGCKHIIVLQDAFGKWHEEAPTKNTNTATIVEWLQKNVFYRFDKPDMITTDSG